MNLKNILVNQESSACAPRIHTALSCKKLPTAIVGFYDSWLTIFIHCIYRLIHCGQNTVGTGKPTIQQWVFLKNWQDKTCERLAISDGIICAQRNGRNIHEYLTKIKKSEENLQCFSQHDMIEASMDNNYNNFNNAKQRKITYSLQGEETNFIKRLGNYKSFFLQSPLFFLIKIEIP